MKGISKTAALNLSGFIIGAMLGRLVLGPHPSSKEPAEPVLMRVKLVSGYINHSLVELPDGQRVRIYQADLGLDGEEVIIRREWLPEPRFTQAEIDELVVWEKVQKAEAEANPPPIQLDPVSEEKP